MFVFEMVFLCVVSFPFTVLPLLGWVADRRAGRAMRAANVLEQVEVHRRLTAGIQQIPGQVRNPVSSRIWVD